MIFITKKKCKNCNINLKININWYYASDTVFCSKFCRKSFLNKKNDSIYLGTIYL